MRLTRSPRRSASSGRRSARGTSRRTPKTVRRSATRDQRWLKP
jgi:hypothetical protein